MQKISYWEVCIIAPGAATLRVNFVNKSDAIKSVLLTYSNVTNFHEVPSQKHFAPGTLVYEAGKHHIVISFKEFAMCEQATHL